MNTNTTFLKGTHRAAAADAVPTGLYQVVGLACAGRLSSSDFNRADGLVQWRAGMPEGIGISDLRQLKI